MLEVQNLIKDYENKPLLTGVSFTVDKGQLVCLLGASGSGKSTVLRIIAGLEEPQSGAVLWQGQDLCDTPTHKRGFGLMFQDYALFPHKTVAQNIAFGLQMQRLPEDEIARRVRAGLESIRMLSFADRPVTELSGGEQQMLSIGRALMSKPRLLLLDEPSLGLAPIIIRDIFKELKRINEEGVTILLVEQNARQALLLSHRGYVMQTGRILMEGPASELLKNPDVEAAYLGTSRK